MPKRAYNIIGFFAFAGLVAFGLTPEKALDNVRTMRTAVEEFFPGLTEDVEVERATPAASPAPDAASLPAVPSGGTLYTVTKIADGDTIDVSIDGKNRAVRMIGIDTPEVGGPYTTVECFGEQASAQTKKLLVGQQVSLETDPTQGEQDKYGRMLAYVWRADGLFINRYLVKNGYAYEYTYAEPYKYRAAFKSAQAAAQKEKRGLWASGVCE